MVRALYATREMVMDALDTKMSMYRASAVDRALASASDNVDGFTHRIFYPLTAIKSWPYPNWQDESTTLWLDGNELASLTTLTSGGATIPSTGYYLEPQAYGPPYNRIEINRGSNSAFSAGSSGPQRAISVTGVFMGCPLDEPQIGTASIIASTASTSVTLTTPVGVGSILRIDSERMLVAEKTWTASGQTGTLATSISDQTLSVSDGTVFSFLEYLLIDAEIVQVLAVNSNVLIVKRAVQGSTLAAHATSAISWSRTYTVTRGALGTTAATHAATTPVYRFTVPPLIEQLTIAYALDRGLQEITGYARIIGSGDNERNASYRGIRDLEADVRQAFGRLARFRSV